VLRAAEREARKRSGVAERKRKEIRDKKEIEMRRES
jgi:hypothetical protein